MKCPSAWYFRKAFLEEVLAERGREDTLDGDESKTSKSKRPHGDNDKTPPPEHDFIKFSPH